MTSFYLVKPYLVANRWRITAGLLCLVAVDFMQLIIPRVVKSAIDDVTIHGGRGGAAHDLWVYALYIMGLAIMIGCFRYIWRRCLIGMSRQVEEGLRNRLFSHLQTLSPSYFDHAKTGDIMAHAVNDITHVRMATGMGMVALTDTLVLGTAAVGFMAYINLKLTLYVLIPMPFIAFCTRFFSAKMHHHYQRVQAAFSDLTETVREHFAGIRIIKAYHVEGESIAGLETISKAYIDRNLKLVRITRSFFPMMMFFSNISLAMVLFLGGRQTITATITPGDFVAFISYLGLLTWPMMAMGWLTNLIQRGKASLDRIDAIMKTQPQISSGAGAYPANKKPAETTRRPLGAVSLSHVFFAYDRGGEAGHERFVLKDISVGVTPGSVLGIAGPPGSGKTTLLQLIPRLYDVGRGIITMDGMDIRRYQLPGLRKKISFMPQEPFLFAGTVRDNITLTERSVDERLLMDAVQAAGLEDTIRSFPQGLDTVVGERGVMLSGGQKQRVALARSLLNPAPILILDDPISQVDVQTGSAIIQALRSRMEGKTLIIASHRISALAFADDIIVLDGGRITESGTHDTLLAANQYYATAFQLQQLEGPSHAL